MSAWVLVFACLFAFQAISADPGDGCCFYPNNYPGVFITGFTYYAPDPQASPFGVTGAVRISAGIQDQSVSSTVFNGSLAVTYLTLPAINNSFVIFRKINANSTIGGVMCAPLGPPGQMDNSVCYGLSAAGRPDPDSESDCPIFNRTTVIGGKQFELYSRNVTDGFFDTSMYGIDVSPGGNCLVVTELAVPTPVMQNYDPQSIDNQPTIVFTDVQLDGNFPAGFFSVPKECGTATRLAASVVKERFAFRKLGGFMPTIVFKEPLRF